MSEQLLTIADVASELRCSTKTVRRAIDSRALAAVDIANRGNRAAWRVRRTDLDEWIAQRTTTRATQAAAVAPVLAAVRPLQPRRRRGTGVLTVNPGMGRKSA